MTGRTEKNYKFSRHGFTLMELLIAMAVLILAIGAIIVFQGDLLRVSDLLQESFFEAEQVDTVLGGLANELRAADSSRVGSYPLEIAIQNALAFYVNLDGDLETERVHYFLVGSKLYRSRVDPAGSPFTYSTTTFATEELKVVLHDVVATSTPIFLYYDAGYAGTTTPLTFPVSIPRVTHVGITISVDQSPGFGPPPVTASTNVSPRNL